jgi:hypothetical protein
MEAKEQLLERRRHEEELNSAYRQVFGKDPAKRTSHQNRVINDFYDILRANVFLPDSKGHYDSIRAAVNDGGRKMIVDMLKRINSTPDKIDAEDAKGKPKVNK